MTWEEAQQSMRDGNIITHEYFTPDEWFQMINGSIVDEQGYSMTNWYRGEDWQKTGFRILEKEV